MKKIFCEYIDYIKFISKMVKIRIIPIFILCFIGIITSVLGGIIVPYISKYLMDNIIKYERFNDLISLIPIIIIIYLVYLVLDIVNSYISIKWQVSTDFGMKCRYYSLMNTKSFLELSKVSSSDLFYRMFIDGQVMSQYLYTLFVSMPCGVIFCFLVFTVMLSWSWQMALYTLILVVISITNIIVLRKPIIKINTTQKSMNQDVAEFVIEKLGLISFAQVNGINKWWEKQVNFKFLHTQKVTIKNNFISTLFNNLAGLFQQLWSVGFLILGVYLIFKGHLTIGSLFGFQSLVSYFMPPLSNFILGIFSFQDTKVSYDRYKEYCAFKPIIKGHINDIGECKELQFHEVSFSYPKYDSPVINKISCKFSTGTITSVIGENGAGKTTLMMLGARLISPDAGLIKINGININDIDVNTFHSVVGIMAQSSVIFHDTFMNNLTMENEYTTEQICYVVEVCGLKRIIDKLPQKDKTILGKDGVNLSGGEAQRLALARILLKQPQIIWLDEPTASIDEESSNQIISALINYKENHNVIIIINTHYEYIISNSDYIIHL